MKILEAMMKHGWHNIAAINISPYTTNKSTLIFKKEKPRDSTVMCVSLSANSTFYFINVHSHLIEIFMQIVHDRWFKGIKADVIMNVSAVGSVHVFILSESLSRKNDSYTFHLRSLLCNVIESYAAYGWRLIMTGDVSAGNKTNDKCTDFWFERCETESSQTRNESFNCVL